MKVVTICGSMKYQQQMQEIAGDLAVNKGWCVLQCVYGLKPDNLTSSQLATLKNEHYKRIELSDAVYVVNIDGYVGDSTRQETLYAEKLGKEIIYYEFDLVNELNNYKPFDEQESKNVKTVLQFLRDNTNCYDRSNLAGHVTAGGLVVDGLGNVLLNHHKKTGMWFQFGGHCDGESNCLNVALREISEEAGIFDCKLISNKILDVDVQKIAYSAKKNEPEHFHYDINFMFLVKEKNFNISNESSEIKWVTIEEAKELVSSSDKAMQRMLAKYQAYCKEN